MSSEPTHATQSNTGLEVQRSGKDKTAGVKTGNVAFHLVTFSFSSDFLD